MTLDDGDGLQYVVDFCHPTSNAELLERKYSIGCCKISWVSSLQGCMAWRSYQWHSRLRRSPTSCLTSRTSFPAYFQNLLLYLEPEGFAYPYNSTGSLPCHVRVLIVRQIQKRYEQEMFWLAMRIGGIHSIGPRGRAFSLQLFLSPRRHSRLLLKTVSITGTTNSQTIFPTRQPTVCLFVPCLFQPPFQLLPANYRSIPVITWLYK
mgnify:CR=1 FL=1